MDLQPQVDHSELVTKSDLRVAVAELKSDLHHTIWISQGAFAAFISAVFAIVTVFG